MINKKEDLYGTEFAITNKEEAQALQDICGSFGIEIGEWYGCRYTGGIMRGLVSFDIGTAHSCKLVFTSKLPDTDTMEEFKLLRKADISEILKEPKRTKVEYVKVELTRKEFACELIDGNSLYTQNTKVELYFDEFSGKMKGKNSSGPSWDIVIDHGTYLRRIETPIEWWEDASEFVGNSEDMNFQYNKDSGSIYLCGAFSRDEACDFARILLEQGE